MKRNKSTQAKKTEHPSTISSQTFKVIPTTDFVNAAKALKEKYPNIGNDFYALYQTLKIDPITGNDHVRGDVYKIRMKITDKNKGERAGARVIVEVKIQDKIVYVLYCYDKSELSDVENKQLDKLIARARAIVVERYKRK